MPTNILRNPEKCSIPTCTRNARTMTASPPLPGKHRQRHFTNAASQSVSHLLLSLSNMFTFRNGKGHVFVSSAYWVIGWVVGRCWCSGYLKVWRVWKY